jgi:hypothetical protein
MFSSSHQERGEKALNQGYCFLVSKFKLKLAGKYQLPKHLSITQESWQLHALSPSSVPALYKLPPPLKRTKQAVQMLLFGKISKSLSHTDSKVAEPGLEHRPI